MVATPGWARMAASAGNPTICATSAERSPPGDGPRTTRPTFGLAATNHWAVAAGKRLAQCRVIHPSPLYRQARPAQPGVGFPAEREIDAAAPGIDVDEQRLGRGEGERRREHRGSRTTAPTDHGEDRAAALG